MSKKFEILVGKIKNVSGNGDMDLIESYDSLDEANIAFDLAVEREKRELRYWNLYDNEHVEVELSSTDYSLDKYQPLITTYASAKIYKNGKVIIN